MKFADIALLTVLGDDRDDLDLLLGSLRWHQEAGFRIVIWHTGYRELRGISWPSGVTFLHRPGYGHAPDFDYGQALNDATWWIKDNTDVIGIVRLDACEFLPRDWRPIEPLRQGCMVRVRLTHHLTPVWAAMRRASDTRVIGWPIRGPEPTVHSRGFHPVLLDPAPVEIDMSQSVDLPRLRLAIGARADQPPPDYWRLDDGPTRVVWAKHPWPRPLLRWRQEGIRPSTDFQDPTETVFEEREEIGGGT